MANFVHQQDSLVVNLAETLENVKRPWFSECCIYKVPKKLRSVNEAAYTPQFVSIGPLHYGQETLNNMEKHKFWYLRKFLGRAAKNASFEDFVRTIKEWESRIRYCYVENFDNLCSDKFVQMILVDAGFIFELFLRYRCPQLREPDDPISYKPWLRTDIQQDLILLENQLPFFILERLYDLAFPLKSNNFPSFRKLTCSYFSRYINQRSFEQITSPSFPQEVKHFTDLLRSFQLRKFHLPNFERMAESSPEEEVTMAESSPEEEVTMAEPMPKIAPTRQEKVTSATMAQPMPDEIVTMAGPIPETAVHEPTMMAEPKSENVWAQPIFVDIVAKADCMPEEIIMPIMAEPMPEAIMTMDQPMPEEIWTMEENVTMTAESMSKEDVIMASKAMPETAVDVSNNDKLKQNARIDHLYSATELHDAGVKFEVSQRNCFLDIGITYTDRKLKIPWLKLDDNTERFIRNLMALEQCHYPKKTYICEYVSVMDHLVNTVKDVDLLVGKKIIVNMLGDREAVATLFNNLCTHIFLSDDRQYEEVREKLNKFYEVPAHKWKANLWQDYFSTPWRMASTSAAIVLLLLTLTQTICSIFSLQVQSRVHFIFLALLLLFLLLFFIWFFIFYFCYVNQTDTNANERVISTSTSEKVDADAGSEDARTSAVLTG